MKELEQKADAMGEESKITTSVVKSLSRIVAEHKDVTKLVVQINSMFNVFKDQISQVINEYSIFSELWTEVSNMFSFLHCFNF